ncbi:MAG TPA: HesA/MoeB/ThiF family protein [Candidatus Bathyarchaeia archaeon]|nr:HesA/MoeB/ThiF family protein [Candidatus Bathyarchaeia archaeon]
MNLELMRYFSRQTTVQEIGVAGLARLQSAKLAVVGTGGVGSAAAYFLASQGIGHLKLIDQDIVEESNLHRLIGVEKKDLHQPKAEALARKLSSRHPWTETEAIVETLRSGNISQLLDDIELIVDGTDNLRTRYLLNRFAMENHIPYLFTSAIANQGHLSLFNPPATPCLECLIPNSGVESVETCEFTGVTPTVVGIIGTLAATEAAKKVLELPTRIQGRLLTIDLAGPDFVFTTIAKKQNCDVCNGSSHKTIASDKVVMLCGDNVANIFPKRDVVIDLQSLKTRVPKESVVASSESVFVYTKQLHRVSVFKTGRLLIGNVPTEEAARQIASEIWKEIL